MSGTSENMVTIDRATLATYQRALGLLNKMADHPEKGTAARRLMSDIEPTLRFPENAADAVVAPLRSELESANKKIADLEAARENDRVERETREAESKLRGDMDAAAKTFGLTDEGRAKMEERMRSTASLDAEAAAAWVAAQAPKPQPSAPTPSFAPAAINLFGSAQKSDDESVALLHTNPVAWQDREIAAMLSEQAA